MYTVAPAGEGNKKITWVSLSFSCGRRGWGMRAISALRKSYWNIKTKVAAPRNSISEGFMMFVPMVGNINAATEPNPLMTLDII